MPDQKYALKYKWGTSRGVNTQGYTICTLYADGQKVASCNGGGYDMKGTCLADWICQAFGQELRGLAAQAHSHYLLTPIPLKGRQRKQKYQYDRQDDRKGGNLYGMTAHWLPDGSLKNVTLDGGCGFESMRRTIEALGYEIEYVVQDVYIVRQKIAAAV
jgi:hypothetical protein